MAEPKDFGPECDTLSDVEADFVRVVHPTTGRFLFEVDLHRMIIVAVDRGKEATIDLARLAQQHKNGA